MIIIYTIQENRRKKNKNLLTFIPLFRTKRRLSQKSGLKIKKILNVVKMERKHK